MRSYYYQIALRSDSGRYHTISLKYFTIHDSTCIEEIWLVHSVGSQRRIQYLRDDYRDFVAKKLTAYLFRREGIYFETNVV